MNDAPSFDVDRIVIGNVCAERTSDRSEWRVYTLADDHWSLHSIETTKDAAAQAAVSLAIGGA